MDKQYNDQMFEVNKVVISRSMDRQYNDQKEKVKTTMIYKTLHRKLKIEDHEPH
jgi:hypothetical protein